VLTVKAAAARIAIKRRDRFSDVNVGSKDVDFRNMAVDPLSICSSTGNVTIEAPFQCRLLGKP
jgi:hypothetical protein